MQMEARTHRHIDTLFDALLRSMILSREIEQKVYAYDVTQFIICLRHQKSELNPVIVCIHRAERIWMFFTLQQIG